MVRPILFHDICDRFLELDIIIDNINNHQRTRVVYRIGTKIWEQLALYEKHIKDNALDFEYKITNRLVLDFEVQNIPQVDDVGYFRCMCCEDVNMLVCKCPNLVSFHDVPRMFNHCILSKAQTILETYIAKDLLSIICSYARYSALQIVQTEFGSFLNQEDLKGFAFMLCNDCMCM